MVSLQSSDFWKLANCFHSVPFNPTFLAHFLRNIFKCSEVVSIQLLSVSETCNDLLWYLWFSSFSVSVGLKVFRSLHWFTEASLLINLEMLFLFSSCLLRKLPLTSCDSYGSLIPHDLEILVVDDLILSNLMFKPIMVQWGLSSSVSTCAAKFVGTDFHCFNDPSPPGVSDLVALLNRVLSLLSVYPLFSILPGSFLSENRWFSSITHFSLFIGKCLHSSFINSSLCLLQMRAL